MVIVLLSPFSEALLDGQLHPLLHAVDVVVVHHQVPNQVNQVDQVDQHHFDEQLAFLYTPTPMSGIDNYIYGSTHELCIIGKCYIIQISLAS